MIVIRPNDYVLGAWVTNGNGTHVMLVIKHAPNSDWELCMRVRHDIREEFIDERKFYRWNLPSCVAEQDLIESGADICKMSAQLFEFDPSFASVLIRSNDLATIFTGISSLPGALTEDIPLQ